MTCTICITTCPNREVALSLARRVVELQLAACVNIIPGVESVFRWEGSICVENEVLLVMKTREHLKGQLEEAVRAAHPYEVPEFVVVTPSGISNQYSEWLDASVLPLIGEAKS